MARPDRLGALALLLSLGAAGPAGAQNAPPGQKADPVPATQEPGVSIYTLFAPRAAHLQSVGEFFSGAVESAATGSGLLIGSDLVLTASHVVPDFGGRYKSVRLDVRLGSRTAQPRIGRVIARSEAEDLALVEIDPVGDPAPFCPIQAVSPPSLTPPGSKLYVLSYPLDEDLSIVDGLLRNQSRPDRWQTNAAVTTGDSGGAVFSARGYLVGLVIGGITQWTDAEGKKRPVTGINAIIPVDTLMKTALGPQIAAHVSSDCWKVRTNLPSNWNIETGYSFRWFKSALPNGIDSYQVVWKNQQVLPRDGKLPPELLRAFTIDQMKDDHPSISPDSRSYGPITYKADPGYVIDQCTFRSISANNESGVSCKVADDRLSATFTYKLTSGPVFDRWRGWLHGAVSLHQKLVE